MTPAVSVGMPVYNGENFLAAAIRSVLGQTFGDLELIICDNASNDGTEGICRDFERRDRRVRYFRNPHNLGADPNYNLTFAKAHGRFFKWAAHDDCLHPTHLARCIEALEALPEAVLAQSLVEVIDGNRDPLGTYDSETDAGPGAPPSARFARAVLRAHWCTDIFGVIRSDALRRTGLHRGYHHSDRVLLAELSLLGRFARVPDALFLNRDHDNRYVRSRHSGSQRHAWHSTARRTRLDLGIWRMLGDYHAMIGEHLDDRAERRRCRRVLARWFFVNWNLIRLVSEPVGELDPRLAAWIGQVKRRTVGPAASAFTPRPERDRGRAPSTTADEDRPLP